MHEDYTAVEKIPEPVPERGRARARQTRRFGGQKRWFLEREVEHPEHGTLWIAQSVEGNIPSEPRFVPTFLYYKSLLAFADAHGLEIIDESADDGPLEKELDNDTEGGNIPE